MNLIEKGYFYKIKQVIDEFTESNKESKDITAILYASFWVEKLYIGNPLDDSSYANDTIFKASLSLKLYKIIRETETKITSIFGEVTAVEKLLHDIFGVIDFDNK